MRILYEEKTFESYFNSELAQRGIFYFPPGQVQEGSIGADSIVNTSHRKLWRQLGYRFWFTPPYQGVNYRKIAERMEELLGKEIKNVPDFRANIFFQYKRSEQMIMSSAEEWGHWNEPYFRYEIYPEQQALLEALHHNFGSRVLILYAAPLVQSADELIDLHVGKKIIQNTNFRPAHELKGHKRNTFIEPGGYSWACSEPARLAPFDLDEAILRSNQFLKKSKDIFAETGKTVEKIMNYGPLREPFRKLQISYGYDRLDDDFPLLKSQITMTSFRDLTGLQWTLVTN